MKWILEHKQYINTGIQRFFQNRYPQGFTESERAVHDAVQAVFDTETHSRVHPILSMVAYEEVLGLLAADSVVDILIGMEFLYVGTSLHIRPQESHMNRAQGALLIKESLPMLVGDILIGFGVECLCRSGKVNIVQEGIIAMGIVGMAQGHAREIVLDQSILQEHEYIAILDEKYSRMIGASLVTGALVTGDVQQRFLDELKRFGIFLSRMYQIRIDIAQYESEQKKGDVSHGKGVVDFLGYDKATTLLANIEYELVKMTNNFQSPKFKDLVEYFAHENL